MEIFIHAATQMLILFTIVLCGVLARKKHLMNDGFDSLLSRLVMTVALPGMILNSVLSNSSLPDAGTIGMVMLYSAFIYVMVCSIAWVLVRFVYRGVPKAAKGAHAFLISFGNTGFIGFAVIASIMGSDAVLYAAIYNISYNLFMFSVGIIFIANSSDGGQAGKHSIKTQIKAIARKLINPCLIACFAAAVLAMLDVTDTGYFGTTCSYLGQMTVPAAMLITGSTLAKQPVREMLNDVWSYITSILRLVIIPLLVYVVCGLFIHDPYILAICVLETAMPAASSGVMFCLAYGGDTRTMARGTFITTILSIITIPVLALIVV